MLRSFTQRFQETVVTWIFKEDTSFMEALYAILAVLWGLWVLAPQWQTFTPNQVLYRVMARLAPEEIWGAVPLVVGVVWFLAVVVRRYPIRRAACFMLFLFWTVVSITFVMGSFSSTATVIYPLVAIGHAWAFWRLGLQGID